MKKTLFAAAVAALSCFATASAELVSNIGVTSNYIFRGMTFSSDDPAIFGGLDYADESGLYVGTWVSSLTDDYEVDLYAGFGGEVESIGYDVGVVLYAYPNIDDANYVELYGSLSFEMFTVGAYYTIQSDVNKTAGQDFYVEGDLYVYLSAGTDLPETLGEGYSISGTIGQWMWDEDGVGGSESDFTNVQIDLSKDAGDFGSFTLSASLASSEISATGSGDTDPRVFVTWGKEF